VTVPPGYFDQVYAGADDPWDLRGRWYERRKRSAILAALPQERYRRGFEPGCAVGALTAGLAERCDELLAVDRHERPLAAAAETLAGHAHVRVARMDVPAQWPDGSFDLVVLSEIGYYFAGEDLARLAGLAATSVTPGGTLLGCHWRHRAPDHAVPGDEVHRVVAAQPELLPAVRHLEEDFVLDVWTRGAVGSPARAEGLV
jgi:SAM-dependent methyltransferase